MLALYLLTLFKDEAKDVELLELELSKVVCCLFRPLAELLETRTAYTDIMCSLGRQQSLIHYLNEI